MQLQRRVVGLCAVVLVSCIVFSYLLQIHSSGSSILKSMKAPQKNDQIHTSSKHIQRNHRVNHSPPEYRGRNNNPIRPDGRIPFWVRSRHIKMDGRFIPPKLEAISGPSFAQEIRRLRRQQPSQPQGASQSRRPIPKIIDPGPENALIEKLLTQETQHYTTQQLVELLAFYDKNDSRIISMSEDDAVSPSSKIIQQVEMRKEGDSLFFMHVPKTAGFTFTSVLHSFFNQMKNDAMANRKPFPLTQSCRFYCNCPAGYEMVFINYVARACKLFYGHMDFSASAAILESPATSRVHALTVLREPVKRVLSEYYFAKDLDRHPAKEKNMTLEAYVYDYMPKNKYDNIMTRMLAGVTEGSSYYAKPIADKIRSDPALMLAMAKHNLLSFAFIGIQEFFNETTELLRYTFNWSDKVYIRYKSDHIRTKPTAPPSDEVMSYIAQMEYLDIEIYRWALPIFRSRVTYMMQHPPLNALPGLTPEQEKQEKEREKKEKERQKEEKERRRKEGGHKHEGLPQGGWRRKS